MFRNRSPVALLLALMFSFVIAVGCGGSNE